MSTQNYDLTFLNDVTLDVVKTIAKPRKKQVIKIPEDNVDLRVFSNGRIFPSSAFAGAFDLEYQPREVLPDGSFKIKGKGLDIFNSEDWGMIQGKLPEGVKLIFVAAISKAFAKVDVWGSTKYNDDNTPKATVFEQGATTYGKNTLVPMLTEIYGINWEEVEYVDLKVSTEIVSSADGIYHLPKKIAAGANKGKNTYVRRENLVINPLLVVHEEPSKNAGKQTTLFEVDGDPDKEEKTPELSSTPDTNWEELGSE